MSRRVLCFVLFFVLCEAFEEDDKTSVVDAICWWKGLLPDPYSCTHFLYCEGPNTRKATRYSCPENSRFDPRKNYCTSSTSINCYEWRNLCRNQPIGKLLEHPLRDGVWATCGSNFIMTCPSHHHRPARQTPLGERCEFECPGEGFFPEPLNGGEVYHACVMVGTTFEHHIRVCAKGTTFLPPNTFCTPKKEPSPPSIPSSTTERATTLEEQVSITSTRSTERSTEDLSSVPDTTVTSNQGDATESIGLSVAPGGEWGV